MGIKTFLASLMMLITIGAILFTVYDSSYLFGLESSDGGGLFLFIFYMVLFLSLILTLQTYYLRDYYCKIEY